MTSNEIKLLEFLYNRLVAQYKENPECDYMDRFHSFIDGHKADALRDRYVIVCENDIGNDRWMESRGPIAMETYVGESTITTVIERAEKVGNHYGRQMICRLDPIGDLAAFKKLMNQE